MVKEILLPHFYPAQADILNSNAKFITMVAGRRAGKTFTGHWCVILASLTYQGTLSRQSPQMVVAALPTLKQAKPIMWEPLVSLFESELSDFCLKIDRSRNVIYPHVNGVPKPPIMVAGANDQNGDRLRGLRIYFLLADEFQDWKADIWEIIVRPAMADTPGSRAVFCGTPKGKFNGLYRNYKLADKFPDTYKAYHLRSIDNPFGMSLREIEEMRLTLRPRQFRQEVEGSFEDFEGKVFSELSEENIVLTIPQGKPKVTVMGIDWGDVNPCIVVWSRWLDDSWYLRAAWVGNYSKTTRSGNAIPMSVIKEKAAYLAQTFGVNACYCDPSRPANILEIRGVGASKKLRGLERAIAGYNSVQDGIDYMHDMVYQRRLLIPQTLLCDDASYVNYQDVFDIFMGYHRDADSDGTVLETIAEGQIDDIIDASRYALVPPLSSTDRISGVTTNG